jgi:hypothetical protein
MNYKILFGSPSLVEEKLNDLNRRQPYFPVLITSLGSAIVLVVERRDV